MRIIDAIRNRIAGTIHPILADDNPQGRQLTLTVLPTLQSFTGDYDMVILDRANKRFHWLKAGENPREVIAEYGLKLGACRLYTANEMQERFDGCLSREAVMRDRGWVDADARVKA